MSKSLRTFGQTVLIFAGAGYGLLRSLRVLKMVPQNEAGMEVLQARIDTIHMAVARLADQTEQLQSRLAHMVTRDELPETLDRIFGPMERGIDVRFAHQARSVETLQTMVGQTDELLQRVLDGLESMKSENDSDFDEEARELDLTRASR